MYDSSGEGRHKQHHQPWICVNYFPIGSDIELIHCIIEIIQLDSVIIYCMIQEKGSLLPPWNLTD